MTKEQSDEFKFQIEVDGYSNDRREGNEPLEKAKLLVGIWAGPTGNDHSFNTDHLPTMRVDKLPLGHCGTCNCTGDEVALFFDFTDEMLNKFEEFIEIGRKCLTERSALIAAEAMEEATEEAVVTLTGPEVKLRTIEEIKDHIETMGQADFFGYWSEVLAQYVPALLKPEFSAWPLTESYLKEQMFTYLREYGFPKAIDHRGISASRSVTKMKAWMWALGDDEGVTFADDEANYQNYGMPVMKYVARRYNQPMPQEARDWPDGAPCTPGCEEGCGLGIHGGVVGGGGL